jgi:hypothetical protein
VAEGDWAASVVLLDVGATVGRVGRRVVAVG